MRLEPLLCSWIHAEFQVINASQGNTMHKYLEAIDIVNSQIFSAVFTRYTYD